MTKSKQFASGQILHFPVETSTLKTRLSLKYSYHNHQTSILDNGCFIGRFVQKGKLQEYLSNIPVQVIIDDKAVRIAIVKA